MQGGVVQVIIDDSTDKVVTGTIQYDNGNGGKFIRPKGTTLPSSGTEAGEWFYKSDSQELY